MRPALFALAASVLTLSMTAHADLLGDSVNVTYAYPDQGTVFANLGNFTVPASGTVTTIATFQLTPSQILISDSTPQTFNPTSFNGFEFTDVTTDPGITGVTLDAASTFMGAVTSFTSNEVFINFEGLTATTGQTAVFDLSFAPPVTSVTPEPSSIALLGTGLLGMAGTLRRRFVRS